MDILQVLSLLLIMAPRAYTQGETELMHKTNVATVEPLNNSQASPVERSALVERLALLIAV